MADPAEQMEEEKKNNHNAAVMASIKRKSDPFFECIEPSHLNYIGASNIDLERNTPLKKIESTVLLFQTGRYTSYQIHFSHAVILSSSHPVDRLVVKELEEFTLGMGIQVYYAAFWLWARRVEICHFFGSVSEMMKELSKVEPPVLEYITISEGPVSSTMRDNKNKNFKVVTLAARNAGSILEIVCHSFGIQLNVIVLASD